MSTQLFNRPGRAESEAEIYIRQARERLADPEVERLPNDTVLVVLGAVLTAIETRLPRNGNGRMAKANQVGVPAAGGVGLFAVIDVVGRLFGVG